MVGPIIFFYLHLDSRTPVCCIIMCYYSFYFQAPPLCTERNISGDFALTNCERKLFIAFSYYVVFGTMTLAAFCLSARNVEQYASELGWYFSCSEVGIGHNCKQYKDNAESNTPLELAITAYILLGLFPAVNLMYTISTRRIIIFLQSFLMRKRLSAACQSKAAAGLPIRYKGSNVQRNEFSCIVIDAQELQMST